MKSPWNIIERQNKKILTHEKTECSTVLNTLFMFNDTNYVIYYIYDLFSIPK